MTVFTRLGALAAALTAMTPAAAFSQTLAPTVVEAVCLEGGRDAETCACAEQRLFERLGRDPYAQYEAVAQAYLADRDAGWAAAAADIAATTGADAGTILSQTRLHGEIHREEMRACR